MPDGRVLDGDLDGEMVLDMSAYEFTHVSLAVEGQPVLGGALTLATRTARYGVVLAGESPLRGSWTVPTSWYPGTWWRAQAIARESVPSAGNTSNPVVFEVESAPRRAPRAPRVDSRVHDLEPGPGGRDHDIDHDAARRRAARLDPARSAGRDAG